MSTHKSVSMSLDKSASVAKLLIKYSTVYVSIQKENAGFHYSGRHKCFIQLVESDIKWASKQDNENDSSRQRKVSWRPRWRESVPVTAPFCIVSRWKHLLISWEIRTYFIILWPDSYLLFMISTKTRVLFY